MRNARDVAIIVLQDKEELSADSSNSDEEEKGQNVDSLSQIGEAFSPVRRETRCNSLIRTSLDKSKGRKSTFDIKAEKRADVNRSKSHAPGLNSDMRELSISNR